MTSSPGWGRQARALAKDRSVAEHKLERETWKRVAGYAKPFHWLIMGTLAMALVSSLTDVVPPLLFKEIIDRGVLGRDLGLVIRLSCAVAGVAVLSGIATIVDRWCSSRIGEGLIFNLRTQVFAHVSAQPIAFFSRTHTGKLVSRIHSDVIGAQRAFTSVLSSVVYAVIKLALVLVAMFSLSPYLTLIALVLLPLFWLPARFVGRQLADLTRDFAAANGEVSATMTERFSISGALLVKLFGRTDDEQEMFAQRAGVLLDTGVKIAMVQKFFVVMMTLLAAIATALVYGLGGYWAIEGRMSVGSLTALAALIAQLYGPLLSLSNSRVDIMSAMVSFERVFEVLDLKPMITQRENPTPLAGESSVEFAEVHFTYPNAEQVSLASLEPTAAPDEQANREVLKGISFVAQPGQTVALVGPSGSGKTTMTHLIARLYDPSSGVVRVCGTDVREAGFAELQQAVGYVTQDAHMFHDTIRNNLRYAKPAVTDEEMWQALQLAHIDDLVRRLPDGLDTMVGERGYRLSGGERQRLAIARLLVKAPGIVVLDEATAHLDSESEVAVQRALDQAMQGRTSIVIAHRLSTIRDADLILVVQDGQIVERGTHEDLLASGGVYQELHETQFADQES